MIILRDKGIIIEAHYKVQIVRIEMSISLNTSLPPDLERTSLDRFDSLLEQGEILYKPPRIDIISLKAFPVIISGT